MSAGYSPLRRWLRANRATDRYLLQVHYERALMLFLREPTSRPPVVLQVRQSVSADPGPRINYRWNFGPEGEP